MTRQRGTASVAADQFRSAATRFRRRLTTHSAGWWTRHADEMHALVQQLADLAADAEGEPHRQVPRITPDNALADQFAVVVTDLLTAPRNGYDPALFDTAKALLDSVQN